ncbi:ABC transporter permease subunit [Cupriavidus sp. LEh25]|nr:ABC transporter permease subunit [Cupriavidus sp. LEh25]MBP0623376.1 ABC transporter permease subunit [Cupriavidus sp. LEh25]
MRGLFYQVLLLSLCVAGIWYLAHNTLANMAARGIQSGWGFLDQPAGFDISESIIPYDALDPYWEAFLVGILNTLRVAVIGIVAATVLGTLLALGRLSQNALLRGFSYGYVEVFRNIPLLLQLLTWYLLITELLPGARDAISFGGGAWLSKGGLAFPIPDWAPGHAIAGGAALLGLIVVWWYRRRARQAFEATGRLRSMFWVPALIVIVAALIGWLAGGAPSAWSVPTKQGFAMEGGAVVSPEFLAVLMGLVLYTAAFVSEVVRSGLKSVAHGQIEAASSLGLSRGQAIRLVMMPQAMRVIIPPMTSTFLALTKNSSLAVVVGYPDIVSIATTSLNQTGRAVECILVVMMVYLVLSLATAAFMNWYNGRVALQER